MSIRKSTVCRSPAWFTLGLYTETDQPAANAEARLERIVL